MSILPGFISISSNMHCPSVVFIADALRVTPRKNVSILLLSISIFATYLSPGTLPFICTGLHKLMFTSVLLTSPFICVETLYHTSHESLLSTRSNLLAHTLHVSGMLTLSPSNQIPNVLLFFFICVPRNHSSPRECELNQTLKLNEQSESRSGLWGKQL